MGVALNKAEGPVKTELRGRPPLIQGPHGCRQCTLGTARVARARNEVFDSRKERRGRQATPPHTHQGLSKSLQTILWIVTRGHP